MLGIGRWRKEGRGGGCCGGGGAKSGCWGRLSPAVADDDADGDTEAATGLDGTRDRLAAAEDTFEERGNWVNFNGVRQCAVHGATGYLLYVRYFYPHPQHTVTHLLTVLQSGIVYHV